MAVLGCVTLSALGCVSTQQAGVIAMSPDGEATIPGPMPGFGPFDQHMDALLAACPRILAYDNAVVTRPVSPRLRFHRSVPKEYCAWIYSTPTGQYEMSLAAMNSNRNQSRCRLPDHVLDTRFSEGSLGYVFAVHNHPMGTELSHDDIGYIVEEAMIHGMTVRVREKEVDLGIAAFFSLGNASGPPSVMASISMLLERAC
jgi:hypothetical protein